MHAARLGVLVAAGMLASCTLIVSPQKGQSCTADEQCAATSALAGFPETCRRYFCNEGTCLEYEDGDEICDGWDNDCDGVIDEPSDAREEPWRAATASAQGVPPRVPLSYGGAPWALTASWAEAGIGGQAEVIEGTVTTAQPMHYLTTTTDLDLDGPGCFYEAPLMQVVECSMASAASAPTHEERGLQLLATVTTQSCAAGRLLIGHTPPPSPGDGVPVVLRAPIEGASNSVNGIDTGGGSCTGASRPGCVGTGGGCGAGRPSISAIASAIPASATERRVAEGLVAWVGDTVGRPHCGAAAAPVEAVVAHLQRRFDRTEHFWVTSSGEAIPERLGETVGGGAPASASWRDQGWVLAFGNAEGNVELVWIPSQPDPPSSTSGEAVPPLVGVTTLGELTASGADHVALAIGSVGDMGLEVGLVWLEGCGSEAQRIVFQRIAATVSGADLTSVAPLGASVPLDASETSLGAPALAYSSASFLVAGTTRADQTVTEARSGGWVALWSEGDDTNGDGRPDGGRLMGARVAELDGTALEDAAPVGHRGDAPYVAPSGRFAFRGDGGSLMSGAAVCSPSPD